MSKYGWLRLKRPQSTTEISALLRMIRPPIVGVVPFPAWLSGVPSRTTWWTDCRFSAREDDRADDERQQQRRHRGADRAERDVVEDVENPELARERKQKVVEHNETRSRGGSSACARRRRDCDDVYGVRRLFAQSVIGSTSRSSRIPREPLRRITASGARRDESADHKRVDIVSA